ncbi:ImmA/IrrE family metallo-endopeptidase [Maridesulfovibrio sp.]|uniref:ImmA/IrrE family metallo-endopeptidase n=1 Tax=Maridesulfovibrio sp. TaxID=2795000 RepID=UPI002AA76626|nr:ImmA/IrrE family metallo-endopeptidase [Maridesulfovibrio sp.]
MTRKEIEALAEGVACNHRTEKQCWIDVHQIVKKLGGKIEYAKPENKIELCCYADESFKIILLRQPHYHEQRDRWSIAHALGHVLMHSHPGKTRLFTREENRTECMQANWFAAGLLMPKTSFLTKAKELRNDTEELASLFWVMEGAASSRLESFRLGLS